MTPDLRRLLTCIGRLEPDRQRMLLLAYYGAFTHEQLAGKLNMPVNLLRSSLRRCLAEIDVCLKPMNETGDIDTLAAEYVLGTLDAERARAGAGAARGRPGARRQGAHLGAAAERAAPDGRADRARGRDLGSHQAQGAAAGALPPPAAAPPMRR